MRQETAESIAIQALSHIASDNDLLGRFMETTGLALEELREAASEPGFLSAVLTFLRQDEPECLCFSSNAGLSPTDIQSAAMTLEGHRDDFL